VNQDNVEAHIRYLDEDDQSPALPASRANGNKQGKVEGGRLGSNERGATVGGRLRYDGVLNEDGVLQSDD
jgi:hypothetical protein